MTPKICEKFRLTDDIFSMPCEPENLTPSFRYSADAFVQNALTHIAPIEDGVFLCGEKIVYA